MSPADLALAARTAAHVARHIIAEVLDPRDTRHGVLSDMELEALRRLCEHAEAGV